MPILHEKLAQVILRSPLDLSTYPHQNDLLTNQTVPPLGVFMIAGCGVDFWINVLLTILG
jgi:hypothetical protein